LTWHVMLLAGRLMRMLLDVLFRIFVTTEDRYGITDDALIATIGRLLAHLRLRRRSLARQSQIAIGWVGGSSKAVVSTSLAVCVASVGRRFYVPPFAHYVRHQFGAQLWGE